MLSKGIIGLSAIGPSDYFSPIFPRPKKSGETRVILNLKSLNKSIESKHFKLESIRNVKHMIRKDCWMASVDLKDAHYSIPIHPRHQKFLKFLWKNQTYKYTSLPNGYSDAMRIFSKLLKPVFGHLRMLGYLSVSYVDESHLQGVFEYTVAFLFFSKLIWNKNRKFRKGKKNFLHIRLDFVIFTRSYIVVF